MSDKQMWIRVAAHGLDAQAQRLRREVDKGDTQAALETVEWMVNELEALRRKLREVG